MNPRTRGRKREESKDGNISRGALASRRSQTNVLEALSWLRRSGVFSDVGLRNWNQDGRAEVLCVLSDLGRKRFQELRGPARGDSSPARVHQTKTLAITQSLASIAGCPQIDGIDFEDDDIDFDDQLDLAPPSAAYLYLRMQGWHGKKRHAARRELPLLPNPTPTKVELREVMTTVLEILDLDPAKFDLVATPNAAHSTTGSANSKSPGKLMVPRGYLVPVLLLAQDRAFYGRQRRGRPGYVREVRTPDHDYSLWIPIPGKGLPALLETIRVWGHGISTLKKLAEHLNKSRRFSLDGKRFTEASVVRPLIAAELIDGNKVVEKLAATGSP